MKRKKHATGLMSPVEQGCPQPNAVPRRPPGSAWITDEAIADTRRVWSPYYGREISESEAVEILMNVKELADYLIQAKRKRSCTTV
jgi:hypothetical protein